MYSLAKDLLFLHGYVTRPEDLVPLAQPEPARAEAPAERAAPLDDTACGAC